MRHGPRRNHEGIAQETRPTITGERNALREMRTAMHPGTCRNLHQRLASLAACPALSRRGRQSGCRKRRIDPLQPGLANTKFASNPEPPDRKRPSRSEPVPDSTRANHLPPSHLCLRAHCGCQFIVSASAIRAGQEVQDGLHYPGARRSKARYHRSSIPSGAGRSMVDPTPNYLASRELSPMPVRALRIIT